MSTASIDFGTVNRHIDRTCTPAADESHCHCTMESYKINTGKDLDCMICGPLVITMHADGFDQYEAAEIVRARSMAAHPAGKGRIATR